MSVRRVRLKQIIMHYLDFKRRMFLQYSLSMRWKVPEKVYHAVLQQTLSNIEMHFIFYQSRRVLLSSGQGEETFQGGENVSGTERLGGSRGAGRDGHGRAAEIADGVSVHWVGGHCAGQEVVRVRTARGWVVLASDALHYYEEYERGVPFAVVFNSSDMIAAHDTIRAPRRPGQSISSGLTSLRIREMRHERLHHPGAKLL